MSKVSQLKNIGDVMFGCDPEFFFANQDGTVVGSEKVIPEKGVVVDPYVNYSEADRVKYGYFETEHNMFSRCVIDGVQAELNPRPNTCRESLAYEISTCFRALQDSLTKNKKNVAVSFEPVVKISKAELKSLSEKSQQFGCAPSKNLYDETASIKVDPKKYLRRSAGGHIHIGSANFYSYGKDRPATRGHSNAYKVAAGFKPTIVYEALHNASVIIPMLDIIVGNTCVLIDRNPENIERRKHYGRAGEHRMKWYGIEYRPLSNFWLQSYQLMSFVMGLCRYTTQLVATSSKECDYVKAFMSAVNQNDIIKAINENDFDLAYENFKKIEPLIAESNTTYSGSSSFPLNDQTLKYFHHFIMMGTSYWFKEDSLTHWIKLAPVNQGWESFLSRTVADDMVDFERRAGTYNFDHLKREFKGESFVVNTPRKKVTHSQGKKRATVAAVVGEVAMV